MTDAFQSGVTTHTVTVKQPPKPKGWCDEQGISHAWEVQPYTLTTNPPQSVRTCVNCGETQTRVNYVIEPEWK